MRGLRVLALFLLLGCSKRGEAETKWGDPVGIELAGQDLMAAVATEAGHDLDAAAVPELATALAGAAKACPDLKTIGSNTMTLRLSVKGGALLCPPDPKSDPLGQCVAGALDGKPVTKIGNGKLMIQFAGKEAK